MRKDDNWLNAAHFACPHCGEKLYRVDHSPMADDYELYCYHYGEIVIIGERGVDIMQTFNEDDLTLEDEVRFVEFEEKFHRHENIWKSPD